MILPPIPYDPTGDTLPPRSRPLVQSEGVYYEAGSRKPYLGLAARYYDVDEAKIHLRYTLRNGRLSGPVDGWDPRGMPVYNAEYLDGKLLTDRYNGDGHQGGLPRTAGQRRCGRSNTIPRRRSRRRATGSAPPPKATTCSPISTAACR